MNNFLQVKISSDYKYLRVYWYTRGLSKDEEVEILLNKNAAYLRHELSQLRVMGNVPNIHFVKGIHCINLKTIHSQYIIE